MKNLVFILLIIPTLLCAATLEEQAREKIVQLQSLIFQLENKEIDSQQEQLAVRTAEVFLKFANWDEDNIDKNTEYYQSFWVYADQATTMAQDLPDFERADVISLLDEKIAYAQQLLNGKVFRTPTPKVAWEEVSSDGDQMTFDGRPVFLADYTWKPDVPELNEFYGHKDGFYISPLYVTDAVGTINANITNQLSTKADGRPWCIFIANNKVPEWTTAEYGEDFTSYIGDPFHMYDIDHPGAREMMGYLLDGTVPYMAGKKYAELGYMLCNEPRWITYKDGDKKVWYNSPVSDYTMVKFRTWLEAKYGGDINQLNNNWQSYFTDFSKVNLDIPLDVSYQGKPVWYDWNTFNDDRVLEWFTWMKAKIRESDPDAKVYMKIMPSFFTDNDLATGIDFEALTELSEVNGNDCAAHYNDVRATPDWDEKYSFGWRELHMGYDFLKSVRPENINFNSESHLLTTGHTRDLYMNPKYVRAAYWMATILGMDVSQTWYWPRNEDGSITRNLDGAYAGSVNQQARVTNELHSTVMDLNSFSEEIMQYQRERKPLRVFYSKTTAHNYKSYMDELFDLYESLSFEGLPLGFVTENIISQQDNSQWDAVLIYKTEYVKSSELAVLQQYLDNGGHIIMDDGSLKKDEYGRANITLSASNGTLTIVNNLADVKQKALAVVDNKGHYPRVAVSEVDHAAYKTCMWRCVENDEGKQTLTVVNYGKEDVTINIELLNAVNGTRCKDLIRGVEVSNEYTLAPFEVLFVEVTDAVSASLPLQDENVKAQLYPSVTDGYYNVALDKTYAVVELSLYNMKGQLLCQDSYLDTDFIKEDIGLLSVGNYILMLNLGECTQSLRISKV